VLQVPGGQHGRPLGIQVMRVPAQSVLNPCALGDQVLAVADQQLDLPAGPSRRAWGSFGSCSAARATARASIGSDLPGTRLACRVWAIRRGGTITTCSTAASRSASSRPATCRQSSTRSGQRWRAQPISSWWSLVRVPRLVVWVSCRPTGSVATTVWLALWGSTPSVATIAR
jgi:hypothetical protein